MPPADPPESIMTTDPRPARGTRPSNRRELIVVAAGELFACNGYAKVAMSNIAEAVAIGPSALYRHFSSKQQLLGAVIRDTTDRAEQFIKSATATNLDDLASILAEVALANRASGILWQRESRHLAAGDRSNHHHQYQQLVGRIAADMRSHRADLAVDEADLLARSALAIANSVSFHQLALPNQQFHRLLTGLVRAALVADIIYSRPENPRPAAWRTQSRREKILGGAVELFSDRGFADVSMDDIGAAVGIAGPSLYNHFPRKTDILAAALISGGEWLRLDLTRAFAQALSPQQAVAELAQAYVDFAFDNPHLVHILISESHHLPEAENQRVRAVQHAYIDEWVHLLREVHPDWDPVASRIRAQAAQILGNDIAMDRHVRSRDTAAATTSTLACAVLGLPRSSD